MTDTTLAKGFAAPTKRLYIKTYGCQMNVYDSERMADVLRPLGYGVVDAPEGADLVVLNTCHIREKAAEKVYSDIGRLKPLKAEMEAKGGMTIAVAGCVAQAEGAEIIARAPAVDIVVGPQAYHQLPELIARSHRERGETLAADFAPEEKFDALPTERTANGVTAFLTVQEGCDKFCTFCVVPYTRGAEWSRPAAAIVAEARSLAEQGVREITLLGQNVNAYNGVEGGLAALARAVAAVPGIARIRYMTSHPRDMDDALIAAHGEVEALMPFLHLPVQSGSDKILKAMNRAHTAEHYVRLVETHPCRTARHGPVVRLHRRLPRRDRGGFRGHAEPDPGSGLCLGLLVQILAPPRHPSQRHARAGGRGCENRAPTAAAGPDRRTTGRLQRRAGGQGARRPDRQAWPQSGAGRRAQSLPPGGARVGTHLIGQIVPMRIIAASRGSLTGEWLV